MTRMHPSLILAGACLLTLALGAGAQDHPPSGVVANPNPPLADVLAGNEFAVASSAPWPDPIPTHVHSDDTDPFGVGTDFAEVGECCSGLSFEEVRGMAEFDLAGAPEAGAAILRVAVAAQGGLFSQPGGDFEVTIDTYDGNNLEEMADYAAVSTGIVDTLTTGGLVVGETLEFDITAQYQAAVSGGGPSLGVRLAATSSPAGAAIVFENLEIETFPPEEPVVEIPTLGMIGLVVLVVALGGLSVVLLRRRKPLGS